MSEYCLQIKLGASLYLRTRFIVRCFLPASHITTGLLEQSTKDKKNKEKLFAFENKYRLQIPDTGCQINSDKNQR